VDHLDPDQRQHLRDELERQLTRLERSMKISEAATETVELDQTAVGRLSRMDSLQNQSLAKNLAEREQAKLAHLLEALKRWEAGVYGVCTECREPVAFGRLLIMPESPTCASCG